MGSGAALHRRRTLFGPIWLPYGHHTALQLMTGFHAPRLVTSVEEVLPKHPGRMASVGGAPGHTVFHGNELPHRNSRPNRTRQLLSWPDGLSLLPDPFPQQARPEAEARGGGAGVGLSGSEDGGGGAFDDLAH